MSRISLLLIILFCSGFSIAQQRFSSRVLLIPLDDRPPCLQFTEKMGLIANTEVVSPPKELLGKFTEAGQPDKIISWIKTLNLKSFNAIIVSVDMLAYGGLVASRVYQTNEDVALKRIEFIREMHKKAPQVPVYGQSVIMRLAPTSDGLNEAYREKLAKWASISPYEESRAETIKIENEIPATALNNYKLARKRNLAINLAAVSLTQSGVFNYLILSQDDAKPRGVHVSDREKLISEVSKRQLGNSIIVQPGTDEISMLLLTRALNKAYKFSPAVRVIYSSEEAANTAMPFEDRPLRKTVSYDIIAAGAKESSGGQEADLLFYVFASRFDAGSAQKFAAEIAKSVMAGKKVMIADVDPKGATQGGDSVFTSELLRLRLFPELYSYASWNTAGNTIGTTLPQGLIYDLAKQKLAKHTMVSSNVQTAQNWFTFHRVIDDYYFHTLVRAKANVFFNQTNRSGFASRDEVARQVEKYSGSLLLQYFNELAGMYSDIRPGSLNTNVCKASGLKFSLPWNRTFEAEIDFKMDCGL